MSESTLFRNTPVDHEPHQENRFFVDFSAGSPFVGTHVLGATLPVVQAPRHSWAELSSAPLDLAFLDLPGGAGEAAYDLLRCASLEAPARVRYQLHTVSPTGDTLETWYITGSVSTVAFGKGHYGSQDVRTVTLHLTDVSCHWTTPARKAQFDAVSAALQAKAQSATETTDAV